MDDLAVVPVWVAPAHQQVVELNYMAHELATTVGAPHGGLRARRVANPGVAAGSDR